MSLNTRYVVTYAWLVVYGNPDEITTQIALDVAEAGGIVFG